MTSAVFDLATIVGALDQIDRFVGTTVEWRPEGPHQTRLFDWRAQIAAEVARLRRLDGRASTDADELNRFLAEQGFSYRFSPLTPPAFGAASTLRESTTWPGPGTSVPVFAAGRDYRGFILSGQPADGFGLANGLTVVEMPHRTTDPSTVWLLLGDRLPDGSDPFELYAAARSALAERATGERQRFASVTMPEVQLSATNQLEWLAGLRSGGEASVAQAVQEANLRIDRTGSEAAVATAAVARTTGFFGLVRDLTVDRPFVGFWTDDAAQALPLAVARFDFDSWSAWDSDRADRENAELEKADAAAREAAGENEAPRKRSWWRRFLVRD
jgi:hypothetical protein